VNRRVARQVSLIVAAGERRFRLGAGAVSVVGVRVLGVSAAVAACLVGLAPVGVARADTFEKAFTHAGTCSHWTVPDGLQSDFVQAEITGQAGRPGQDKPTVGAGGKADQVLATIPVRTGEVLNVCVAYGGGKGLTNPGPFGLPDKPTAGAGGGASSVVAPAGFAVAGGGGGGGAVYLQATPNKTGSACPCPVEPRFAGNGGDAGDPAGQDGAGSVGRPLSNTAYGGEGGSNATGPGRGGGGGFRNGTDGKPREGDKQISPGGNSGNHMTDGGGGGGAGFNGGGGGGISDFNDTSKGAGGGGGTDMCHVSGVGSSCRVERGKGIHHGTGPDPGYAHVLLRYDQLPRLHAPVLFLAATQRGAVYHSILSEFGIWRPWHTPPGVPADVTSVAATGDQHFGETQYLVATPGGRLYHAFYHNNGGWSLTQPVWRPPSGISSPWGTDNVVSVAAASDGQPGNTEYLVATSSGLIYHSVRRGQDGSWFAWRIPRGLDPSDVVSVAATGDGRLAETQYLVVTRAGVVYHAISAEFGNSWTAWSIPPGIPAPVVSVAATDDGHAGETQYLVVSNGNVYHAIRYANGSWTHWSTPPGLPSGALRVAATSDRNAGETQYLVGTTDGHVYHTIRREGGAWEKWTTPHGIPADIVELAAAHS
jgi:hypothetical protein